MNTPLFILAFDHRASFVRSFLGVQGEPGPDDIERARTAKDVIAEGLAAAVAGGLVAGGSAAALVDATYGASAIEMLRGRGIRFAVPVEASGRRELAFEDGWRERLRSLDPAWAKVLVRSNPAGDAEMNARQVRALRLLRGECDVTGRALMLELLVPPEPHQVGPDFDTAIRPGAVVDAIGHLRAEGVTPDLWKIEGFEDRQHCEAVAAVAGAPCVVLGRGQDDAAVDRWLRAGAGVAGFVGFAIGRSIWWEALRAYFEGGQTAEARSRAAEEIARAYGRFVEVFAGAALGR